MSTLRLTRLALPELRRSGRGRVVNITSSAVKEPNEGLLLSNTYRPGVIGWAKTLSQDEGPHGITVNSIAPGYIDTERMKNLYAGGDDPDGDRRRDEGLIPARRFGDPAEIGDAVRVPLLDPRRLHQRHHDAGRRRPGEGAPELSGRLAGKSIVVTGGSSGLGRAMSLAFAAEGAARGDRRRPRGPARGRPADGRADRRAGRQRRSSSRPTRPAGTTSTGWCATAVERARPARRDGEQRDRGRPALEGAARDGPRRTGTRSWTWACAASSSCCKRAVQQMLEQEPVAEARGRIINLSSQHGMVGAPGAVAYCTAKGGVVNLTRQVAVDFGPRGIIVNAIAPGQDPDAARPTSPTRPRCSPTRTRARRSRGSGGPTTWPRRPSSWPRTSARYVSGTNLLVDGGWMAY